MAPKGKGVSEGQVKLALREGVFYNPEMELCRDLSSLCVGAIGGRISVVDAMCASGVRGIRYRKENANVESLSLVDMSSKAVGLARRNAKLNRVRCAVARADAREFLRKNGFDFVELDPFGSPAPYLHDAACSFREKKSGYLSVTATDMAVLCGAHHSACLKNYGAAPLDNEFCHENACRILAGKTTLTFAQFNFSAEPMLTFSHRHYVKIIFRLSKGSQAAVESVKSLGFVSYCPSCCFRSTARLAHLEKCPHCAHRLVAAGPLYLGGLWSGNLLEKMLQLNAARGYKKGREIEKILRTMLSESSIGSYGYYDLHTLAKKAKKPIKGMDAALESLRKAGFSAERTHFCPTAVRTDAPHAKAIKILCG